MFNSLYMCLDLLDDSGLPLHLLGGAAPFIDLLSQALDVPLGVQEEGVVRVVLRGVFQQVLHMTHIYLARISRTSCN